MLNKNQIENNIAWLLENATNPVKYLTYKNLLKDDSAMPQVIINKMQESDLAKDIFSKQKKDGSWCSSGAWAMKPTMRKSGYTPVSPEYVTTAWILPILGNLGYTVKDESISKACEYILSYQQENDYIGEIKLNKLNRNKEERQNEPCRFSIILIGLAKVDGTVDSRIKKSFDLLESWQRKDGGWVSENHSIQKNWARSCPFSSYHSAFALYCSGLGVYKKSLIKALEFLLHHLSQKKDFEIQRFFYHGHNLIHELLMFTEFKVGLNTGTINSLFRWLLSMYQYNNSYFKYNGKPISKYNLKDDYMDSRVAKYRLFQLVEEDWLTYYSTRIFKNILDM